MAKISRNKKVVPACSTAILSVALAAVSLPATAQKSSLVLEEIVVTATKTEELARDIAISANVLTASDLAKIDASDFSAISKLAPGLDFASTRDPVSGAIKLRNVGSDSFEGGNDKAVAVFVDQYVQSLPNAVFSTMLDVERVEVLRGPQGTLYGKNAPAGVISITTQNPDYEGVSGYVKGSVSNYDTYTTAGAVNVPLVAEKLALRVAGTTGESDGFYYNDFLHNDSGDSNEKDGRLKLLFNATEDLSMLLGYRSANIRAGVPAALFDGPVPNSAGLGPNGGEISSDPEDFQTYSSVNRISDTDLEEATFTVEWDLGDYAFTSLTSYSEYDLNIQGGNSGYPANEIQLENGSLTRQTTQEVRLNSYAMDDLEWLAGIYYSHMSRTGFTDLGILASTQDKIGETWGYFGNAIYSFSDSWKISLGLRYNDEMKAQMGTSLFNSASTMNLADNYHNTSGSFKLQYFATPDVMLYAALDSAYRSGDFNDFVAGLALSPAVNFLPGAVDFTEQFTAVPAEESESLEIGMKGSFLDGRARANIAYFYQVFHDYQDQGSPSNAQALTFGGNTFGLNTFVPQATITIDKLITQGVEMDGQMLFTEHWSGTAAIAYAHAVAEEYPNNLCVRGQAPVGQIYCPASGNRLNDDPLWTANVQLAYENSWDQFDYAARLFASWKSAPTYDVGQSVNDNWDAYNSDFITFDANFSVTPVSGDWTTSLWVKNLTDERQPAAEGSLSDINNLSLSYGAFISPRTYGVTAQYNF